MVIVGVPFGSATGESMRRIEVHYPSGWEFLSDYKLLLGAVVVAAPELDRGEVAELICRFGAARDVFHWPCRVIAKNVRTASGAQGVALIFPSELKDSIERTAWSFARGERQRQEARVEPTVSLEVIAEHRGTSDAQRVVAIDISSGGCRLSADERSFLPGDEVLITWTRGQTSGRVCWSDGADFGVCFDQPIGDAQKLLDLDIS
jgi:PilZ domain